MSVTDVFPRKLKEIRKSQFHTQSELAEMIGVTSQTIYKYENGIAFPPGEKIQNLLEVLGATPNDLLWDTEENVVERISKLADEEVFFRYEIPYRISMLEQNHGKEKAKIAVENMVKHKLGFDINAKISLEHAIEFRKWEFERRILKLTEEYIEEQLKPMIDGIEENIKKLNEQREQARFDIGENAEFDFEEEFKDF